MEEFIQTILPPIAQGIMEAISGQTLPDSDAISEWDLEGKRKIYLDTDIGYNMMELHRLILRWNIEDKDISPEDRKPIWLYIMSYGGDLDYMWSLIDTIEMSRTPVYTVNVGVAASAASLIFLAGHKRFMLPKSNLIIHEGSAQLAGDAIKVMDQSESYKQQLKQMKDYILERTEIPRNQLMRKRSNDWFVDAKYCLENKACDAIVTTLDEII